jgi:hypothetical protein
MRSLRGARDAFLFEGEWWWVGPPQVISAEERALCVPAMQATSHLRRWCDDLLIAPRMLALFETLGGPLFRTPSDRENEDVIRPALHHAPERGEFVALRQPRERLPAPPPPSDLPPPPAPSPRHPFATSTSST